MKSPAAVAVFLFCCRFLIFILFFLTVLRHVQRRKMPLLLKMPFSFRALNGVNTCVNMWVFVPLKVCQIFEVCQSVLLRDSHFVSITDLNLESMRRVCVCFLHVLH